MLLLYCPCQCCKKLLSCGILPVHFLRHCNGEVPPASTVTPCSTVVILKRSKLPRPIPDVVFHLKFFQCCHVYVFNSPGRTNQHLITRISPTAPVWPLNGMPRTAALQPVLPHLEICMDSYQFWGKYMGLQIIFKISRFHMASC